MKEYRAKKLKENPRYDRVLHLREAYGMSLEEADAKLAGQGHKCEICGVGLTDPCLDHDHETGKIRDFLCRLCNVGLGAFKDNPELMDKAAAYVRKHADSE
jgi:hypothetical protein